MMKSAHLPFPESHHSQYWSDGFYLSVLANVLSGSQIVHDSHSKIAFSTALKALDDVFEIPSFLKHTGIMVFCSCHNYLSRFEVIVLEIVNSLTSGHDFWLLQHLQSLVSKISIESKLSIDEVWNESEASRVCISKASFFVDCLFRDSFLSWFPGNFRLFLVSHQTGWTQLVATEELVDWHRLLDIWHRKQGKRFSVRSQRSSVATQSVEKYNSGKTVEGPQGKINY